MPAQFDFTPGFDLTSVVSATQSQIQQAIAQIAPLSNIGGVVYGAVAPDVVNNARFSRYMWIDTSGGAPYVLKSYNGAAWVASTVGAGSVSTAAQIVDGIITLAKLSVAGGGANKLIRVNAGNTAFEFINFSDLLSAGSVPFTAIETTGSVANYFLKRNNANTAYDLEAFAASFIPINSIGYTQLQNSAGANRVLVSNAASNAFTDSELNIALLKTTGGTAFQIPRVKSDLSALEYVASPIIQQIYTESSTTDSTAAQLCASLDVAPTTAGGKKYVSLDTVITPKSAGSFLLLEFDAPFSVSAGTTFGVAIFRDGVLVSASPYTLSAASFAQQCSFRKRVPSTAASATTFTVYFGYISSAATVRLNQSNSPAALFGANNSVASLRVTEVAA